MRNDEYFDPPEGEQERLPPHAIDAEKAALGSVLLDPGQALPVLIEKFGTDLTVFYDLRHQLIYEILVKMYDVQQAIDIVTLGDWLMFHGHLEEVGGTAYILTLPECSPSAQNVGHYADILTEHHRNRRLIKICTQTIGYVYQNADESKALIDGAAQDIFDLASSNVSVEEEPMHELVVRAIGRIEESAQHQGLVTGLETGLVDFDRMTTGLHGGEMIVIAGRPSMGKTSLAMNIAEHVAVEKHLPVGVFSLEMTRDSLVMRMLCSRARVNFRTIADGFLAERDMPKIVAAAHRLHEAPIHINDISGLTILGLRTRSRRMHAVHGIKLLIVDYLQLLSAERGRNDNRQNEVSAISSGLKGLAKELNIPVIALSQLNRQLETDKNRRPRLADLRESGTIENDADLVGMLYRPKYRDDPDEEDASDGIPMNLFIAKQRNGPTGDVQLVFLKCWTRFESSVKVSADDSAGPGDSTPSPEQQEFSSANADP